MGLSFLHPQLPLRGKIERNKKEDKTDYRVWCRNYSTPLCQSRLTQKTLTAPFNIKMVSLEKRKVNKPWHTAVAIEWLSNTEQGINNLISQAMLLGGEFLGTRWAAYWTARLSRSFQRGCVSLCLDFLGLVFVSVTARIFSLEFIDFVWEIFAMSRVVDANDFSDNLHTRLCHVKTYLESLQLSLIFQLSL